MADFKMPSLGADMEAGTLTEWRVNVGDNVRRGQVVALVETQKGIIEVEAWQSGVVEALLVAPGTKVPVGTALARWQSMGEESLPPATPSPSPPEPHAAPSPPAHVRASPAARQLARERGVALESIVGTGPHGAVTRQDVEKEQPGTHPTVAVAEPIAAPPALKSPFEARSSLGEKSEAMRRAIGAAMAKSNREIPHYFLAQEVDVSKAMAWLTARNETRPVSERVIPVALFLRAIALVAKDSHRINGHFVDDAFRPGVHVHLGVAVHLRDGGLVVPAILEAEKKALDETMASLSDLVSRARDGRLRSSELSEGTMTVTALGDRGVNSVYGVIYPPQVTLVGLGKPTDRPWARDGLLGVRTVMTMTLAGDHRVHHAHEGSAFLSDVRALIEEPERLCER